MSPTVASGRLHWLDAAARHPDSVQTKQAQQQPRNEAQRRHQQLTSTLAGLSSPMRSNASIWVQTRAHWNSGGPECLVQLACALHDHGHRVFIYPTRIVPRFAREYPCIGRLPQRPVSEARRDEDVVIGPADHACPAGAVDRAWVWMLDTRSAARYRGTKGGGPRCRAFAHNDALATRHGVPLVPLYITPSTVAECARRAAAVTPESRDLILIDDDTPAAVVRRLREAFPASARVVSGYSPAQVRNLTLRARYVVDWSLAVLKTRPLWPAIWPAIWPTSRGSKRLIGRGRMAEAQGCPRPESATAGAAWRRIWPN